MAAPVETTTMYGEEIKVIFSTLNTLIKPPEGGDKITDIVSSLENNLSKAESVCGKEKFEKWMALFDTASENKKKVQDTKTPSWRFTTVSLGALLQLKMIMTGSEKEELLSVNDTKILKSALQFVSALGVTPFLIPGVGIRPKKSSSAVECSSSQNLSSSDKHHRLAAVTRAFIKLLDNKTWALYPTLLSALLTDLVPSLVQLAWQPNSSELPDPKIEEDSKKFRLTASFLFRSVHQPMIIRELMASLNPEPGNAAIPPPLWYVQACSRVLTQRLLAPRGVISTVRALHDITDSSDDRSRHYGTTAKLLTGLHGPKPEDFYPHLCPQILELLQSKNMEYQNVAVYTSQILWTKAEIVVKELILDPLFKPLFIKYEELEGGMVLEVKQEESISSCISLMLALASPAGLPMEAFETYTPDLCNLYMAIWERGGTPQLRCDTKALITKMMLNSTGDLAWRSFLNLPEECLLNLANDSSVANKIFINLLQYLHKSDDIDAKIQYCALLTTFADLPVVQKQSLQKPTPLLIETIKKFLEDSTDFEMVQMVLLLLGAMVSECEEWSQYQSLVPALQNLRKSKHLSEGVRAIAEEIISTIATHGAVGMDKLVSTQEFNVDKPPGVPIPEKKPLITPIETSSSQQLSLCEALNDLEDTEIPVVGHGYIALTRLIKNKDADTLSSKDKIFELCLKGMQHEDSYVYLAAVGTLSTLSLSFLDDFLPKVMENYCNTEHGPDLRTRLGESLLQVCKELGEMSGKYKALLLNTYLVGAKDESPAIRTSSLSNLGEACKVLGFQVTNQLQEILVCAHALATTDPEIEVRRAATLLLSLLVRGLGTEAVPTLGSSALEVYRSLKQLALSEDDALKLHAQIALDEISQGIKESMLAPQPLEKKIYVTSPPP